MRACSRSLGQLVGQSGKGLGQGILAGSLGHRLLFVIPLANALQDLTDEDEINWRM